MLRIATSLVVLGVLTAAGCAESHNACKIAPNGRPAVHDECQELKDHPEMSVVCRPSPSLLFNRRTGPVPPEAFTYRSEWPSVQRPYDTDDVIFYVETVRDYEGLWGGWQNQTRRYYRAYRFGVAPR